MLEIGDIICFNHANRSDYENIYVVTDITFMDKYGAVIITRISDGRVGQTNIQLINDYYRKLSKVEIPLYMK